MDEIIFSVKTDIIFGQGTISRLASVCETYGKRVFLVADPLLEQQTETALTILKKRGIQPILFDETSKGPVSEQLIEAAKLAKGGYSQVVAGIGGMDTLHFAKAVAVLAAGDVNAHSLIESGQTSSQPLPFIAVPTVCRDPFLLTRWLYCIDSRERKAVTLEIPGSAPKAAIIDPALSEGLTHRYRITTMLDTLLAAFEGFLSRTSNFISDTQFLKAVDISVQNHADLVDDPDQNKPYQLAYRAGLFASMGLIHGTPGPGWALALAMRARFGVPKSWCASVLTPGIMEASLASQPDKIARMAPILGVKRGTGSNVQDAEQVMALIRQQVSAGDMPVRLSSLLPRLGDEDLLQAAEHAAELSFLRFQTIPYGSESLFGLLKQTY